MAVIWTGLILLLPLFGLWWYLGPLLVATGLIDPDSSSGGYGYGDDDAAAGNSTAPGLDVEAVPSAVPSTAMSPPPPPRARLARWESFQSERGRVASGLATLLCRR